MQTRGYETTRAETRNRRLVLALHVHKNGFNTLKEEQRVKLPAQKVIFWVKNTSTFPTQIPKEPFTF